MSPHAIPNGVNGHDDQEATITVLVTGFGPFQDLFPVNPSFEITKTLPQILPKLANGGEAIKIISYPAPIRVAYAESRELVPSMLESYSQNVNIVLHIGMASGRRYYTAEKYAHRDGYGRYQDVDGKVPDLEEHKRLFGDCPSSMTSTLPFHDMMAGWKKNLSDLPEGTPGGGADVRVSDDAGNYLCDYTYFNSLTWYGRRNEKLEDGAVKDRPVMFLHVPAESEEDTLARGRAVTVALIRSMVDCYSKGKAEGKD